MVSTGVRAKELAGISAGKLVLLVVVGLLSLMVPPAMAQTYLILGHVAGNSDDAQVGLHGGVMILPRYHVSLFALTSFRFWNKTVLQELGPHLYLQREEIRGMASMGLETHIPLSRVLGVYAGAGAGYTMADFEASAKGPEEGWTPVFLAGGYCRIPGTSIGVLRLGYQYADLRSVARNWATAGLGVAW